MRYHVDFVEKMLRMRFAGFGVRTWFAAAGGEHPE
jgi:hypothetical protein